MAAIAKPSTKRGSPTRGRPSREAGPDLASSSASAKKDERDQDEDGPPVDPVAAALGHSTSLRPVLEMNWPDSDLPYLAPNLALALRGAALRAGQRADAPFQVTAADLLAATLALPLVRSGVWTEAVSRSLPDLGRAAVGLVDVAALKSWRLAAGGKAGKLTGQILRWDAVALLAQASVLRKETNIVHPSIGLRHVCFAALFDREGHRALEELGLLGEGIGSVAEAFGAAIQTKDPKRSPRRYGDDMRAWDAVIQRAGGQRLLIAPRPRSGFLADTVADGDARATEAGPPDPLGTAIDAQALADLVLLESARPPLAIGLFGSWGSGKSTLMRRLQQEIRRQIAEEREGKGPPDLTPETRRVGNVAQLEFNAWSFADSKNLWASLTAEVFEQLKAGGDAMPHGRGERLVQEVAEKLASQSGGVEAARASAETLQKGIEELEAQAHAKSLASAAAPVEAVSKLVADDAPALETRLKEVLSDKEAAISLDSHDTRAGKAWWLLRRMYPLWLRLLLPVAAAVFAGAVVALVFVPQLQQWWGWATAALAPILSVATMVGIPLVRALRAAGRYDELVHRRKADLAREVGELRGQIEVQKAELERTRRDEERRAATAATLAETKGQPARLLQYLLSESADIQSIRSQVGLMATVRRCFETLDELIGLQCAAAVQARAKPTAKKRRKAASEPPPIERIILYIDDLDRCSADQVIKVLEAIHLLLAFKCFVVIVAIDARWLRRSLLLNHPQFQHIESLEARHDGIDEDLTDEDEEYGRPSPSDYLEKIFQIPFWVRPLTPSTADGPSAYTRYIDQLIGSPEGDGQAEQKGADDAKGGAAPRAASGFKPIDPAEPEEAYRPRAARVQLGETEHRLLRQLGPLAAKSPRAVKRLVNIYRLIRAGFSQDEEAAFLGAGSAEIPRSCYVLFALALDAAMAVKSISDIRESMALFSDNAWSKIRLDPNLLGGPSPFDAVQSMQDKKAFDGLHRPLAAAGRLPGFVAALKVLKAADPDGPDRRQIERAFGLTQRYSFRAA